MIVIYHKDHRVSRIFDFDNQKVLTFRDSNIATVLMDIAHEYPERLLIWCHLLYQNELNETIFPELFHHKKIFLSYYPIENYFSSAIGYIEESPFINVNKKVSYPTWQMSSLVGGIHASVLIALNKEVILENDFDYFLCSIAKRGMPLGLFCYSEPKLLKSDLEIQNLSKPSLFVIFKFVKQHYKYIWVVLLFFNLVIFEKKIPFFPFLFSLFYKKRKLSVDFNEINVQSTLQVVEYGSIDVIIPTIGRERYVYDVLCDLRNQTCLPKNVIIVEQNPLVDSVSELDFITSETWPFVIKHTFTHQSGACNARNLALNQVESEWTFFADDDIRFDNCFFEKVLNKVDLYGLNILTTSCLQKNEEQLYKIMHQSGIFGSGNSFVKRTALQELTFDMALEFGYGEDIDFGMQLRNKGFDVIYFPDIRILHLKAPIGGFRIKVKQLWEKEVVQPRPSPTVLYVILKYYTKEQLLSYKLVLFLKLLKKESFLNYLRFFESFEKKWKISYKWAKRL